MKSRNLLLLLLLLLPYALLAQKAEISSLLDAAQKNLPLLQAKQFEIEGIKKRNVLVDIAKRPNLDASYQADLATYNNLTGMFLSNGIIPISGPPTTENFFEPVFGSAAALLLTWQPFTFGQDNREQKITATQVQVKEAEAENALFKQQIQVANAYLDWQVAGELVAVYQKNVDRAIELSKQINALTINGVKPASDSAMIIGEISRLKIEVINAQKFQENYRLTLANLIGSEPTLTHMAAFFERLPTEITSLQFDKHPLIRLSTSQIGVGEAQLDLIQHQLVPKLQFWGTTYARGSGVNAQGETEFIKGLGFQRFNYGFGAQISYPLLKGAEIKTQTEQQSLFVEAQRQLLQQHRLQLIEQQQLANQSLISALKVAREMPTQQQANEYVLTALTGRYKSGLVNFTEIIQAQYNVIKTESDIKKAHWEAWKALLFQAAAHGDITIFLNQLAD